MKVHGGDCRPNGGPRPCQGEHLYYCALPECATAFKTSANTHSQDINTGHIYASPSYPACGPAHLTTLQEYGLFTKPRELSPPGIVAVVAQPEPTMPNASDVPEGA